MAKFILILCLGYSFILGVSAISTFLKYFEEAHSWSNAQKICKENNGKLMVPDSTNFERLQTSCMLNTTIWVGAYRSLSNWIEIVGCYNDVNLTNIIKKTADDPVFCQHLCQNFTHTGLQDNTCLCISEEDFYDTEEADEFRDCNVQCSGRSEVFCGGNSSVSIYKTVTREIQDEPDSNCTNVDCFCVSADCQTIGNQTQIAYFSRHCSNDLSTVCGNDQAVTGDAPDWKEAISRCFNQQNSYPISSNSKATFCDKTAITWTSIFRDQFIATDGQGNEDVEECQQADLTVSPAQVTLNKCTEKRQFVCDIVLKPGQTEESCIATTVGTSTTDDPHSTPSDTPTSTEPETTVTSTEPDITTTSTESDTTTSSDITSCTAPISVETTASTLTGTTAKQTTPISASSSTDTLVVAVASAVPAGIIVIIIVIGVCVLMYKRKNKSYSEDFTDLRMHNKPDTYKGGTSSVISEMKEVREPSQVLNQHTHVNTSPNGDTKPAMTNNEEKTYSVDKIAEIRGSDQLKTKDLLQNTKTGNDADLFSNTLIIKDAVNAQSSNPLRQPETLIDAANSITNEQDAQVFQGDNSHVSEKQVNTNGQVVPLADEQINKLENAVGSSNNANVQTTPINEQSIKATIAENDSKDALKDKSASISGDTTSDIKGGNKDEIVNDNVKLTENPGQQLNTKSEGDTTVEDGNRKSLIHVTKIEINKE